MKAALLALPLLAACHAQLDNRAQDAAPPVDATPPPDLARQAKCNVIFDNTNTNGVLSGAVGPTFSLGAGFSLCEMWTYHWNDGAGATGVHVGLTNMTSGKSYGPYQAAGSSGQGGSPGVNWDLVFSPRIPLDEGEYQVVDSDPASWSWNSVGHEGFAKVLVVLGQ